MLPFAPWLVWIIPSVSALLVPLFARLGKKARDYFVIAASLVTVAFALSMVPDVYFNTLSVPDFTVPWIPSLGTSAGVFIDPLSILFANLVALFGLVIAVYSLGYMAGEEGLTRYYFFFLLFIGSMIGLVVSDNFLQLFVFWEMVGLCSYSLVSFWYKRPEAVRAGLKVFITTRIGDVCLLAAIALLYASLGSFSFTNIAANIQAVPLQNLTAAAFLMLIGALAKSAQLPFHTWLYGAMEAPTSVSALLHGATMVKAGVYLIARLFFLFGSLVSLIPMWLSSLAWVGAITAFVGATLALHTPDIKGVAAYSTISQIGFMMAALGAATSTSSLGWFAGLFHLVSHAFFQGLDFLLIGGIVHALGTRDMRLMGGLRKVMPITFGLSMIAALGRAGLPPFMSFFSKELEIESLFSTGNVFLILIIYASTAITFAYTLRVITLVYTGKPSEHLERLHPHEAPRIMLFSSGILAVLFIAFGLLGNLIALFMHANLEVGLSEIFSSSTLIFLFVLLLGGFPVYLVYYRKIRFPRQSGKNLLAPLKVALEKGYFFDAFYENAIAQNVLKISYGLRNVELVFFGQIPRLVAGGIVGLARNVRKYVEKAGFDRIPRFMAGGVVGLARNVRKYVEKAGFDRIPQFVANAIVGLGRGTHAYLEILVNEVLYIAVNRALLSASKVRKMQSGSIQHFVTAVLLGFLILLVLILVTLSR